MPHVNLRIHPRTKMAIARVLEWTRHSEAMSDEGLRGLSLGDGDWGYLISLTEDQLASESSFLSSIISDIFDCCYPAMRNREERSLIRADIESGVTDIEALKRRSKRRKIFDWDLDDPQDLDNSWDFLHRQELHLYKEKLKRENLTAEASHDLKSENDMLKRQLQLLSEKIDSLSGEVDAIQSWGGDIEEQLSQKVDSDLDAYDRYHD